MSAKSVLGALDPEKYDVVQIGITHDGAWMSGENTLAIFSGEATGKLSPVFLPGDPSLAGLYTLSQTQYAKLSDFDVVFPVLHGSYGEDGTLQGLLEMADVAYVGAGVTGAAVGMDKGIFKDVMIANNIPVVPSVIALRSEIERDMNAVIARIETLGSYQIGRAHV